MEKSVQLATLWSCRLQLPHLPVPMSGHRLPMSGKVGATCSSLELQVAPPAFTDTDEWASAIGYRISMVGNVGATYSSLELQVAPPAVPLAFPISMIGHPLSMNGKVGATCSSLELQVAPPAFTDTDEWASMKQFEKLATQAIRIEFPNSTNAIRQVDRLGSVLDAGQ